jgi:hypothetical protein
MLTHCPETTLGGIEREAAADREMLDRFIAAEAASAKKTRRVHRSLLDVGREIETPDGNYMINEIYIRSGFGMR